MYNDLENNSILQSRQSKSFDTKSHLGSDDGGTGLYLQDNRQKEESKPLYMLAGTSSEVIQMQLANGIYGMKNILFRTNLREDDPPDYTRKAKLSASTQVEVIPKGDKISMFAAGKTVNEHSWVQTPNNGKGWIEDSKLVIAGGSNDSVDEYTLSVPEYGAKPTADDAQIWMNADEDRFEIFVSTNGVEAFLGDTNFGSIQSGEYQGALSISGIDASSAYPGLGSVMIKALVDKQKLAFVRVDKVVGSHGYWKRLGVEIPDRFEFSSVQIDQRMARDGISKRDAIESLARDQKLIMVRGEQVGGNEIPRGDFLTEINAQVEQKGWRSV